MHVLRSIPTALRVLPAVISMAVAARPLHGGEPSPAPPDIAALCEQDLTEWTAWRDRQIDALLEPYRHGGRLYLEIDAVAERARGIADILAVCRAHAPARFRPEDAIARALHNLDRFARNVGVQAHTNHVLGFALADTAYLDAVRDDIAFPELLRGQPFLRALSTPFGYRDALAMIEERNAAAAAQDQWIPLLYKSRFLKTPDETTYGRFFIYVPGNPTRWIQYGIVTPDMETQPVFSVSMVSVRETAPLPSGATRMARIVDFERVHTNGAIRLVTKIEAGFGGVNCYNCHKTPVLPIRPLETYRFDDAGTLVAASPTNATTAWLNRLIADNGPPHFGFGFDTGAFGPSIGPPDRERGLAQLRRWTAGLGLDDGSLHRIRRENCASCHNPSIMGRLNYPTAARTDQDHVDLVHPETGEPTPLIKTYVEEGWMPPFGSLTPDERRGLYRALMGEYLDLDSGTGMLIDWLKNRGHES